MEIAPLLPAPVFTRQCAWCRRVLFFAGDSAPVTHTCCAECQQTFLASPVRAQDIEHCVGEEGER
jgi:hypothetical protein